MRRAVVVPFVALACSGGSVPMFTTPFPDAGNAVDSVLSDVPATFDRPVFDIPARDVASTDRSAADASVTDVASADAACAMTASVPYAARTMNEEFTDPPACSGCPAAFTGIDALDAGTLPAGATTLHVGGTAAGAHRCEWYVLGGSCGVTHGVAAIDPDGAGTFSTTVPVFCGTNTLQVVCSNDAGARVLVRSFEGAPCATTGRDLRVTLSWDDTSRDMELHLLRAPRAINSTTDDCTWFTCIPPATLDWGTPGDTTDNPVKDVDNTGTLGPENIYLQRAPAGTYYVLVEYWGSGLPSTSSVDVTLRERTVARLTHTMIPVHDVWNVGTIVFPAGTFTPADTILPCGTRWMATSRGCDLPLP